MREVGGYLDPRDPGVEDGEVRVSRVSEAIGEADSDEKVGDGGAEEIDDANVVAPADDGNALAEVGVVDLVEAVAPQIGDGAEDRELCEVRAGAILPN